MKKRGAPDIQALGSVFATIGIVSAVSLVIIALREPSDRLTIDSMPATPGVRHLAIIVNGWGVSESLTFALVPTVWYLCLAVIGILIFKQYWLGWLLLTLLSAAASLFLAWSFLKGQPTLQLADKSLSTMFIYLILLGWSAWRAPHFVWAR
jgi:hypothetical protein